MEQEEAEDGSPEPEGAAAEQQQQHDEEEEEGGAAAEQQHDEEEEEHRPVKQVVLRVRGAPLLLPALQGGSPFGRAEAHVSSTCPCSPLPSPPPPRQPRAARTGA